MARTKQTATDPKAAGEGNKDGRQDKPEDQPAPRTAEGTPPQTGEEGGVVEEGTGDFAEDTSTTSGPQGVETVTTETRDGTKVESEVGVDGENPVSPQNPPAKAVLGGPTDSATDNETAKARNEGTSGDRTSDTNPKGDDK
jgi:hypothetical protein